MICHKHGLEVQGLMTCLANHPGWLLVIFLEDFLIYQAWNGKSLDFTFYHPFLLGVHYWVHVLDRVTFFKVFKGEIVLLVLVLCLGCRFNLLYSDLVGFSIVLFELASLDPYASQIFELLVKYVRSNSVDLVHIYQFDNF